jgi:hypothetical protein
LLIGDESAALKVTKDEVDVVVCLHLPTKKLVEERQKKEPEMVPDYVWKYATPWDALRQIYEFGMFLVCTMQGGWFELCEGVS